MVDKLNFVHVTYPRRLANDLPEPASGWLFNKMEIGLWCGTAALAYLASYSIPQNTQLLRGNEVMRMDKLNQIRDLAFLARQKVRMGQSPVYWGGFIQIAHTLLVDNGTNINPKNLIDYLKGDRYDLFDEDQE